MFLLTWSSNAKERKQCKDTPGCFTIFLVTQRSLLSVFSDRNERQKNELKQI